MPENSVFKEIAQELDVVKTWFSPGSAKHLKIKALADKAAEASGGRTALVTDGADVARLATPGPGVRSRTVEVDSVGDIEDKPAEPVADGVPPKPDPFAPKV